MSASSVGVQRMYYVSAPRGDILDCNGVPLATSESVNTVMIANAAPEYQERFERLANEARDYYKK